MLASSRLLLHTKTRMQFCLHPCNKPTASIPTILWRNATSCAIQAKAGWFGVAAIVAGLEAKAGSTATTNIAIPACVVDADCLTSLAYSSIPEIANLLIASEIPAHIPVVDCCAVIANADISGKTTTPIVADGVGNLACAWNWRIGWWHAGRNSGWNRC